VRCGIRSRPARLSFDDDQSGKLIATASFTQKLEGDRLVVHAVWRFKDGRVAVEDDRLRLKPELAQDSFRWVERAARRTFGKSRSTSAPASDRDALQPGQADTWSEKLDLPAGKAFTGYSTRWPSRSCETVSWTRTRVAS